MKLKVLAVSLLAFFAISASAQAFVEYPTIAEREAEGDVYQFMHHNYAKWRHKHYGYVDCRHGRINRFTWSCGVGWIMGGGGGCWQGRVRIINEYGEGGYVNYLGSANVKRTC